MRSFSRLVVFVFVSLSIFSVSAETVEDIATHVAPTYDDPNNVHPNDALLIWLSRAKNGDRRAQFELGMSFKKGRGVPLDSLAAAHWLLLAAEQGHPEAQFKLGVIYSDGIGVEKNSEIAEEFFLRSARQGYGAAQAMMSTVSSSKRGQTYLVGTEIDLSIAESVKWILIATGNGFWEGYIYLGYSWIRASTGEWELGVDKADAWRPVTEDYL